MSTDRPGRRAPILVLGIGNRLLSDDGVGLVLLERLARDLRLDPRVELIDGGTQGIHLAGLLEGRRGLLMLDAVQLGAEPGSVHVSGDPERLAAPRGSSAHEGNARELLEVSRLLGSLPQTIRLVGVEPAVLRTGIGLSPAVGRAVRAARRAARRQVHELLALLGREEREPCTS